MKIWRFVSIITALVLSTNVNAVIINTLNDVNYEWLELTETSGLSRNQVESMLTDSSSNLYGYQYASRSLIEDLLLSYAPYDGKVGFHTDSIVVSGVAKMLDDFGLIQDLMRYTETAQTTDFDYVTFNRDISSYGMYGLDDECGNDRSSCMMSLWVIAESDNLVAAWQQENGWDSSGQSIGYLKTNSLDGTGSYLVREMSAVPVPAATWLFGSGVIGLVGFARRKKA